jgi:HK97 gp10 family phage protein
MAIQGLAQLRRKMRAIPQKAKDAARVAVVHGAEEIQGVQQNLVPYKEGELHDSIHVTLPGQTTPPYSQPGGARTAGPEEAIVTAGNSKVRYAHLVEFGTEQHPNGGMFAGTEHPGTKAQPFFWPGYRAVRKRVRSRITRSINKAIKDVAAGGK